MVEPKEGFALRVPPFPVNFPASAVPLPPGVGSVVFPLWIFAASAGLSPFAAFWLALAMVGLGLVWLVARIHDNRTRVKLKELEMAKARGPG